MTRAALRVVSDGSDADVTGQQKNAIIATTNPALFSRRFDEQLGKTVFVVDNGPDAIAALEKNHIDLFFADFRQLEDRWTGQRFLKYVRGNPQYAQVAFWLMAEEWHPHQEQWNVKCGAMGFVKRHPDVLAKHILGESAKPKTNHLAKELDEIDTLFGKFAGPMRGIHIEDAREAIDLGQIEPSSEAYIAELATKLATDDRRKQFQAAIAAASKKKSSEVTEAGDPWMDAVNAVFKTFAGGLGARLMIASSLEQMEATGNNDRNFYVSDLASRLLNPGRRTEFIAALRKARLVE